MARRRDAPERPEPADRAGRPDRGEPGDAAEHGASPALYVIATPIGNLGDVTHRALEILRGCALVAAEDTRRFRILAERYGIRPREVVRCDEHTEEAVSHRVLRVVREGMNAALTSDAGTPAVADPGYRLVRRARAEGLRVVPVPGPCAPVAALSASGLPTDRFAFAGFPPRGVSRLRAFLAPLLARAETAILLESPERVLKLLDEIAAAAPEREVVVARELTKLHEEIVSGTAAEVRARLAGAASRVRGEIVVLLAGASGGDAKGGAPGAAAMSGRPSPEDVLRRPWVAALSRRDLADLLTLACGVDRNAAYRLALLAVRGESRG